MLTCEWRNASSHGFAALQFRATQIRKGGGFLVVSLLGLWVRLRAYIHSQCRHIFRCIRYEKRCSSCLDSSSIFSTRCGVTVVCVVNGFILFREILLKVEGR
mmetsp:Transcript_4398/g.6398  ORF Transcript_4398/g.6398 Transcript_4398/m.6398 type:complete len:102 (+) Transcript_4398:437-742(+)